MNLLSSFPNQFPFYFVNGTGGGLHVCLNLNFRQNAQNYFKRKSVSLNSFKWTLFSDSTAIRTLLTVAFPGFSQRQHLVLPYWNELFRPPGKWPMGNITQFVGLKVKRLSHATLFLKDRLSLHLTLVRCKTTNIN